MEKFVNYLKEKYRASSIIVYGSYADGSADADSDFDALVLGPTCPYAHDDSVVDGVRMDAYVYPRDIFYGEISLEEFEHVHDGLVALDEDGMGTWLKNMIGRQIDSIPAKPREAVADALDWCGKLCARAAKGDPEGYFQWHWLLTDSVEIYCDVCGLPFLSPAKTMQKMRKTDPEAAEIHLRALSTMDHEALKAWVELLRTRFEA